MRKVRPISGWALAMAASMFLFAACSDTDGVRQAGVSDEAFQQSIDASSDELPDDEFFAQANAACSDPKTWMACMFPQGNLPLTEITMPGSHDAATYAIRFGQQYARGCGSVPTWIPEPISGKWARTQGSNLGVQAANGSRYFDIRPYFRSDGTLSTCHSLEGASFNDAFGSSSEFQKFVRDHPDEIFILDLQQFFAENSSVDSPNRKKQLNAWLDANLGDLMYSRSSESTRLADVDIANMRADGRNVIVLVKDSWATELTTWPRGPNLYSEWNDVSTPAITFWDAPITGGQEQWPIDLAARELAVLDRAPSSGKLNVLNYILDTSCPDKEIGQTSCYSAYVAWAGTISNTRQWLLPRIPSMARQVARKQKAAIVMRDVTADGSNAPIWKINTPEMD